MTESSRLLPAGLELSAKQIGLLDLFGHELRRMNQRINLVSSETESEFWKRHTAHCLALAIRGFPSGSRVVDWGTGGGLPAIPLAIVFPEVEFIGVDSVRKKVQSCTAVARRLSLDNCSFVHGRAEHVRLRTDYSVSRATAPLAMLWAWHTRVATAANDANTLPANEGPANETPSNEALSNDLSPWPRGLICLKGGDLSGEIAELKNVAPEVVKRGAKVKNEHGDAAVPDVQTYPLSDLFEDSWFNEKVIVQVHSE